MHKTVLHESAHPPISWEEGEVTFACRWRSEKGTPPPKKLIIADDTLTADEAYRVACEGTGIIWRGDYQNAKQLLQAMSRRADKPSKKSVRNQKSAKKQQEGLIPLAKPMSEIFHKHRLTQSQRSRTLGMLLIQVNPDHSIPLRRAPDVSQACLAVYGEVTEPYVMSLRDLLGFIGSLEWRKNGMALDAIKDLGDGRIHPHYGVFAPVRSEYIGLLEKAPLPASLSKQSVAFDIGTGTGVLAAVLAKRGVQKIIATDQDERAIKCAAENIEGLGISKQVKLVQTNLFPDSQAALIVCNPPWVPARPSSPIEYAVYDPDSQMLKGFLAGLKEHLLPDGEGWLILSDLAEHLGLRTRAELLASIEAAGLSVLGRNDVRPTHAKALDTQDPLYRARAAEVTSLWRLGAAG
jgi:methylase of polypeptide subunit release factors